VHLYESNGKKAAFLREAIRHTQASAMVHQRRIETLRDDPAPPKIGVVLARALAPLVELLDHARPFLEAGAIGLFHKGQDVDAELAIATRGWKLSYSKHPSLTDSHGVILEVKEALLVRSQPSA
ncbi:MAG: RsmG family class I SAM-dependent methyltransferase, partial [Aestuariivirga sp.]